MNEIPIFDSLTHPMPNEGWLKSEYEGKNSLKDLKLQMVSANVQWALAVGMGENIGGYKEESYATFILDNSQNIFPIAFVNVQCIALLSASELQQYFKRLKKLGYIGVKFHPRFGRFVFNDNKFIEMVKEAANQGLAILLCTYRWENSLNCSHNNIDAMVDFLFKINDIPVILLHGGGVCLMQYIEIARAFSNVLLDLSLTMLKYEGSSIDLDIKFAFEKFDRRICIGTDSPEFSLLQLRERFNFFSQGINIEKLENIGHKNLNCFLGLG